MGKAWYKNRWVNIALHTAFWILFFLVPFLLQPSFQKNTLGERPVHPEVRSFYFNLMKCFFWMALFYVNTFFFVPRFVYKRKYFSYILSLVLVLVLLSGLEVSFFIIVDDNAHFKISGFLMFNLFPFLFIVASGTAYRMFLDKIAEENKSKEKEAENLKSELSFLRSQISPHFMFNVINNIVALARKKSDLVEPSLIKLSSLMRYFLYESNAEKVPLEKEVEYLESYISLQQQRFGKNVVINLSTEGVTNNYEIEPMLLIPFVENAFKHGNLHKGPTDIKLRVKNGELHFSVVNPYSEKLNEIKDETSGIGLANVQRRLNLLYGKRHSLLIAKKDGQFLVSLELKLH